MLDLRGCVGHEGSFPAEVRRVLFYNRIRLYYPSLDLYHHYLGTPVRGQFLMYIRALRATLNQTDRSFKSCVSIQLASYMSFVIPAWLTNNNRFNLPSDPVPLMGPRRLIPMVKTQYLLRKTHFLGEQKTPKGNVRGSTSR